MNHKNNISIIIIMLLIMPLSQASLNIAFDSRTPIPNSQHFGSFLVSTNISGTDIIEYVDFHFYRNNAVVASYQQNYSLSLGGGQVGVGVYNPSVNFTGAVNGSITFDVVAYSQSTHATTGNRTLGFCVPSFVCAAPV